jgi:purine nucleoside permease
MREFMNKDGVSQLSRRNFIAFAGLGAAAVAFAPRFVFAQKKGIVQTMIDSAAQAKIETHTLRRNISVLEGSGGNIAVLTGKDGKLLIDSGFTVSRPRITEALNSLSSDPITQLINTHWHVESQRSHSACIAWVQMNGPSPMTCRKIQLQNCCS